MTELERLKSEFDRARCRALVQAMVSSGGNGVDAGALLGTTQSGLYALAKTIRANISKIRALVVLGHSADEIMSRLP